MRIGIIIPDRGDRPEFLTNCVEMLLKNGAYNKSNAVKIELVNPTQIPLSDSVDIVPRVRFGYERLTEWGAEIIFIIENDDWYSRDYITTMIKAWESFGKPDLFGTCYTVYYHMLLKAYNTMEHHQRASLMNTMIRPGILTDKDWPVDIEPYLDLHLWQHQKLRSRVVFKPDKHISIGMKHNVGLCGGALHKVDKQAERWYENPDNGFLKATLDPESFKFYDEYFK